MKKRGKWDLYNIVAVLEEAENSRGEVIGYVFSGEYPITLREKEVLDKVRETFGENSLQTILEMGMQAFFNRADDFLKEAAENKKEAAENKDVSLWLEDTDLYYDFVQGL